MCRGVPYSGTRKETAMDLSFADWRALVESQLLSRCSITLADYGIDEPSLRSIHAGGDSPSQTVDAFIEKCDLDDYSLLNGNQY